ncbi:MAG: hypothetical protein HY744_34585 [Deltaproteobacteria bacterium]|nr:hypothetical protein [Deltaproteobacteria bacterium]
MLALGTHIEMSYDRSKGFRFRLRKQPVQDKLLSRVLRGLLGLFPK